MKKYLLMAVLFAGVGCTESTVKTEPPKYTWKERVNLEGKHAFDAGVPFEANPYPLEDAAFAGGVYLRAEWARGYNEAAKLHLASTSGTTGTPPQE